MTALAGTTSAASSEPAGSGGATPGVAKVLLVDDRHDNLLALEAVLEPLGLDLVSVASGEEALRNLLHDEFAVVVLDVQMPVLDGFETARLVKAREKTRHLPIIFLTAISGEAEHFRLGYATGAVDYVYKPFDPDILRAKVKVFAELWERGAVIEAQGRELARRLRDLDVARAALARQADELERSNLALDRFAGLVAGELRDPLHTVAGLLELLVARHGPDLDDEAMLLADRAAAGVARCQGVILSLLDFARAGSEGLVIEDVELDSVVAEVSAGAADGTALIVDFEDLPVVRGDRRLLTLLLSALLEVGATEGAGTRTVTVSAERRDGGWAVGVTDPAWKVEPGDHARLFTPVAPAPGAGGAGAVAGVSLALCRRVMERHGGAIGAEPAPGGGTVVWFTLPAAGS